MAIKSTVFFVNNAVFRTKFKTNSTYTKRMNKICETCALGVNRGKMFDCQRSDLSAICHNNRILSVKTGYAIDNCVNLCYILLNK